MGDVSEATFKVMKAREKTIHQLDEQLKKYGYHLLQTLPGIHNPRLMKGYDIYDFKDVGEITITKAKQLLEGLKKQGGIK
jgi:hypothetical protein